MRKLYRTITALVRIIVRTIWGYKIIHPERLAQVENCIVAANHVSYFDPPIIGSIIPREIYYLAKAELFKNKYFSAFLKTINVIPIRRGAIDRKALENTKNILNNGNSILLFPEGTRKSSKAKPGIGKIAAETQKNILPIYLKNTDNLHRCFLKKEKILIVIGKMINYSEFEQIEDRKQKYREIAEYTLNKIMELANDCKIG